ncbi:MAG: hypothetical protein Q7T03_04160 [Deltaproteobacteria bacterium]|nr:hypothetical protein [Deltaproteobacteria bacterium]
MNQPKTKKPYEPPKLVRIKLDAEQAILGTCSTGAVNASAASTQCKGSGGTSGRCRKASSGDSSSTS